MPLQPAVPLLPGPGERLWLGYDPLGCYLVRRDRQERRRWPAVGVTGRALSIDARMSQP